MYVRRSPTIYRRSSGYFEAPARRVPEIPEQKLGVKIQGKRKWFVDQKSFPSITTGHYPTQAKKGGCLPEEHSKASECVRPSGRHDCSPKQEGEGCPVSRQGWWAGVSVVEFGCMKAACS